MKTLKSICFLLTAALLFSCSNDDDTPGGPKGYFPIIIKKTDFTNAVFSRVFELDYNNQNHISNIRRTSADGAVVSYNTNYTNNLLTEILVTGQVTINTVSHKFAYTAAGALSSYIMYDGSVVNTYPIAYFPDTNTYSLTDEDGEIYTLEFNEENTLELLSTPFLRRQIHFNLNNTGGFPHLEFQPALHLFFGILQGKDYYFFNAFEIESVEFVGFYT